VSAGTREREPERVLAAAAHGELDPPDRAHRDDDLVRVVLVPLVLANRDEAEARLGRQGVEHVARPVGELDLDVGLLDAAFRGVALDVAMQRPNELVDRACRDSREPETAQKSLSSRSTAAPTCSRPRSVAIRPRGVRWMKPSWSR
jgi:hypothetical protein